HQRDAVKDGNGVRLSGRQIAEILVLIATYAAVVSSTAKPTTLAFQGMGSFEISGNLGFFIWHQIRTSTSAALGLRRNLLRICKLNARFRGAQITIRAMQVARHGERN